MIFWDTSALIRCHAPDEPGHARAINFLLSSKGRHKASMLIVPELISAMVRKLGRDKRKREALIRKAEENLDRFDLFPVQDGQIELATRLIRTHELRALDALHLAAALMVSAEIGRSKLPFLTADKELASAARSERIKVLEL